MVRFNQEIWDRIFSESATLPQLDQLKEFHQARVEQICNRMRAYLNPEVTHTWEQKFNTDIIEKAKSIPKKDDTEASRCFQFPSKLVADFVQGNHTRFLSEEFFEKNFFVENGELFFLEIEAKEGKGAFRKYEQHLDFEKNFVPTVLGFVESSEILVAPTVVVHHSSDYSRIKDNIQLVFAQRKVEKTVSFDAPHHAIGVIEPVDEKNSSLGFSMIGYDPNNKVTIKGHDPLMSSLFNKESFHIVTESFRLKQPKNLLKKKLLIQELPDLLQEVASRTDLISKSKLKAYREFFRPLIEEKDRQERWKLFLAFISDGGPIRHRRCQKKLLELEEKLLQLRPEVGEEKMINIQEVKQTIAEISKVVAAINPKQSQVVNCRYLGKRLLRAIDDLVGLEKVSSSDDKFIRFHKNALTAEEGGQPVLWKFLLALNDLIAWLSDFMKDLTNKKHLRSLELARALSLTRLAH